MQDYLKQYLIPLNSLKNGLQEYNFEVADTFFTYFEESYITKANVQVHLKLYKDQHLFNLHFKLNGNVAVQCDRCLDYFDLSIENEATLYIKYGDKNSDITDIDDTMMIAQTENDINIAPHIYQYVHLSLPVQHVHPNDAKGKSTCNKEMLKILNKYTSKKEENSVDPRWEELKKIKFN